MPGRGSVRSSVRAFLVFACLLLQAASFAAEQGPPVEKATTADPGCTEVDFFNKKEVAPGTDTAASMFAMLTFMGPKLLIEYVDESNSLWGQETWDSTKNRLQGNPADRFTECDGVK